VGSNQQNASGKLSWGREQEQKQCLTVSREREPNHPEMNNAQVQANSAASDSPWPVSGRPLPSGAWWKARPMDHLCQKPDLGNRSDWPANTFTDGARWCILSHTVVESGLKWVKVPRFQ
jgi:hypothetical protein